MIKIPEINLHLGDCMDWMREKPDGHYDLAVVDPPYFKGAGDPAYYRSRLGKSKHKPITKTWGIPNEEYFNELFRVSKRQIVWGVNYYEKYFPYPSRIVWDKCNDNTPFSQAEIAGFSEGVKVYIFRYKWNGMFQQDMKNKQNRIHPTEKPVALYKWLLTNYAKPGDRILDTHGGSGSSMIACYDLGFDMDWIELDPDYFKSAKERFERHKAQGQLFHIAETLPEQQKLF